MTPSLSDFARRIPPFHVMALLERAQALSAQGHDVIHLEAVSYTHLTLPTKA